MKSEPHRIMMAIDKCLDNAEVVGVDVTPAQADIFEAIHSSPIGEPYGVNGFSWWNDGPLATTTQDGV